MTMANSFCGGSASKKSESAPNPPADAPSPMTGKSEAWASSEDIGSSAPVRPAAAAGL